MSTNDKFDALIGQIIDDRYKILSVVGVGGMSVVFKAEDKKNGSVVAIKILNDMGDADSHAIKRFINESRAVSMLSHENIVKVYDMSLDSELKYIVMELADGITLKDYMAEKGNKLSIEETLDFIEQILLALDHAHEKGVIHRDIKPQNMIVLPDGKLKVTDFGIAKAPGGDTISMTDKALGTVYYISPEQASGKPTGTFSDVYSVGVMLYEMATG
ncbi:MAG: serine/threonine protein kinase, partial [Clostridia bacterium]|nr:serine/threonine protein kinase [Clostridia bacterium]